MPPGRRTQPGTACPRIRTSLPPAPVPPHDGAEHRTGATCPRRHPHDSHVRLPRRRISEEASYAVPHARPDRHQGQPLRARRDDVRHARRQPRPRRLDPHHPQALDAGINFIDTADVYGDSEEVVGKALKGRRDNVVLATKVSRPMGDDPNQQGASRRWIMTAVENSLRRLQTDHIDLYQIHRPDPDTDIEETLSALSDLIHSGKVRAIGTSTMPASDIVEAQWVAERRGLERFRTEQPPYSILNRGIEREVLPVAQRYGMGTLVWGPLGQGHAHRPRPQGPADRPPPRRLLQALQRRAPARRRRAAHPARRGGGPADDPPRDGVRDRSSGRDQRDHRAAHDGATSTTCSPASTSHSPTTSSTGSTRSSRPAPTSAPLDQAYVPPALQRAGLRRRPAAERAAA